MATTPAHFRLGGAGMGTRVKLVLNSWILCTVENIAETFVLADTLGLDPQQSSRRSPAAEAMWSTPTSKVS
jgi:3-hydroxyisobutyrate dehydrogenase-like beta-hydroxyacid dehydrogenase